MNKSTVLIVLCLVDVPTADNKIQMSLQSINLTKKNQSAGNGHPQYEAIETQASVKISTTLWPEYPGLRGRSKELSASFPSIGHC